MKPLAQERMRPGTRSRFVRFANVLSSCERRIGVSRYPCGSLNPVCKRGEERDMIRNDPRDSHVDKEWQTFSRSVNGCPDLTAFREDPGEIRERETEQSSESRLRRTRDCYCVGKRPFGRVQIAHRPANIGKVADALEDAAVVSRFPKPL